MKRLDFEDWMQEVDDAVSDICGLPTFDLPDCCYADWYADGMTPKQAARKAIKSTRG